MKKILFILSASAFMISCGGKKDSQNNSGGTTPATNTNTTTGANPGTATPPPVTTASLTYTADSATISNNASLLVSKDKDKLQAGAPYLCILTSNAARHDNEYLTVNFLLDTKPGTYPVVGASFQRGKSPNVQMFGGLLGGKPTITEYKVNITECKDMGDNGSGGHKWSISGGWEEIVIQAPGMMLMDKTKNHPKEIKLGKGTFTNLMFDDNFDKLMEEGLKKIKKPN